MTETVAVLKTDLVQEFKASPALLRFLIDGFVGDMRRIQDNGGPNNGSVLMTRKDRRGRCDINSYSEL